MEEAANILPFSNPMEGFVAGIQLAQVVPMLDRLTLLVQAQTQQLHWLQEHTSTTNSTREDLDCWLDAKKAAEYLCISKSSFDKYRYSSEVKITGYLLDGKTLYKKSELDLFVRLYDVKSRGFA